jgi:hypothetical protein
MAYKTTLAHPITRHSLVLSPTHFSFENSAFCSIAYLFMCCVMIMFRYDSHKEEIIILVNINRLCFVIDTQCVFCKVGTEILNTIYKNFGFRFFRWLANQSPLPKQKYLNKLGNLSYQAWEIKVQKQRPLISDATYSAIKRQKRPVVAMKCGNSFFVTSGRSRGCYQCRAGRHAGRRAGSRWADGRVALIAARAYQTCHDNYRPEIWRITVFHQLPKQPTYICSVSLSEVQSPKTLEQGEGRKSYKYFFNFCVKHILYINCYTIYSSRSGLRVRRSPPP